MQISEVYNLQEEKYITFISNKRKIVISIGTILYAVMEGNKAVIHICGGEVYETRMTLGKLEEKLGENFIKVSRGCLVSAAEIQDITDTVRLSSGERLKYTARKKNLIINEFNSKQKNMINGIPSTEDEYRLHFYSFEHLPVAFADIELKLNEENRAVDFIFRYGNPAFTELNKMPLKRLTGKAVGRLFPDIDCDWLKSGERAALCGETVEFTFHRPKTDTYWKALCFPTFKGHCGCFLFHDSEAELVKRSVSTVEIQPKICDTG